MNRKRVELAVTGSIAAYKAASLASLLVQEGLEVRVILTAGGARFVTALTFEAITGRAVATDMWGTAGDSPMTHLELARWADALLVAPASADAVARLAQGRADDLLGAVALSFRGPLLIAPAMETNMYSHPATQAHLSLLEERGAIIIGPESGHLASGAEGPGRMAEPPGIAQVLNGALRERTDLEGLRILVTAGPTHEPIDPVRFIGNRSSGKMGYAIAREAERRGANVTVIAGPTSLSTPPGVPVICVRTAAEMRREVLSHLNGQDVVIMAAAVADFTPSQVVRRKLKRGEQMTLELSATDDIAAEAVREAPEALHIGFALETSDLVASAREKLRRKGQQLVVANAVNASHDPFGADTNRVTFVTEHAEKVIPETTKAEVARLLIDEIVLMLQARSGS
ncbi:MAG TPA: bifunctional phosphopantothenoylcysteine decarboxylase/phosphopantothenate--cysteine ligase CoaBC [Chloroflexota bacterium]